MSVSKSEVVKRLPAFKNEVRLVTWQQSTNRIVTEILNTHKEYCRQYDEVYYLFDKGDIYSTCKGIWNFCKDNLPYTIETEDEQSVKSPAAIMAAGQKIDCKHYSLFIGGVLDAMRYNEGDKWDWTYRFASYNRDKQIGHVFVVVQDGNKEIWIDPVLKSFDEHKKPTYYMDKKISGLYSISGTNAQTKATVTVTKRMAEQDFLKLVNMNCFGLKDIMNDNPDVTNGPVKQYFADQGFDFNQLGLILKAKGV